MIQDIEAVSAKVRLTKNYNKTKYMTNEKVKIDNWKIRNDIVTKLEHENYIGQQ